MPSCAGGSNLESDDLRYARAPALTEGDNGTVRVVDAVWGGTSTCHLSSDGFVWYRQRERSFAPFEVRYVACASSAARVVAASDPPLPHWAEPRATSRALFVAGTLQDDLSRAGTLEMAALARGAGIPLTWMLGNLRQLAVNRDVYDLNHRRFGDDLQIEPYDDLRAATQRTLPWFRLTTTIDGGGHERTIAHDLALGARAFWGIAWNSNGIDGNADRGTPGGAYCADRGSYKRTAVDGCRLVGLEWTARDLTRAYFSGHEEAYSTDPDDLLQRASLAPDAAAHYARAIVDAYARAGEDRPLILVAQQEAAGAGADPFGSWAVLAALYSEARRAGMTATTMSDAVARARAFAGEPRAIAFPYIPGLPNVYQGSPVQPPAPYPATIDYADRHVAMTFVAGRTLPVRVYPFDAAQTSAWDRPLTQLAPLEFPALTRVARTADSLILHFQAPVATRFGVAIWSDPTALRWAPHTVVRAGRAGAVAAFDLPAGESDVALRCGLCGRATLDASP